jgi:ubiquitin carboxyl-terminal hydrolase 9/24
LLPFSQQEIMKNKGEVKDEKEEKEASNEANFKFKLRGVVVHTGSADSGHYYSFIDNKQGCWFEFNDEEVMPFDLQKLPDEAFGCRPTKYELKTKNAYLLIYERMHC